MNLLKFNESVYLSFYIYYDFMIYKQIFILNKYYTKSINMIFKF